MDDEILFNADHEPVESAAEVFPDSETLPFPDVVEAAEEVGFPDTEPSAAEYAAQFGENVVYKEEIASDSKAYTSESESSSNTVTEIIPVLDDATKQAILNTESNTNNIESYISSIDIYLSRIDEYIPELDFKIAHIESDVRQIGRNNNLSYKIMVGCIIALLGAIICTALFSKLR